MSIPFNKDLLKWLEVMKLDDFIYSTVPTQKKKLKNKIDSGAKIQENFEKTNIILNNIISSRSLVENINDLNQLKEAVVNFKGCELKNAAKNTVFADGRADSKIMIIGEAPGASEDEQGIPFCGLSGNLLDKILMSIGLSREKNCYITNTIFWRPPANRRPTDEEIEICKPFVEKHIALIKPKLLIMVGSTAITSLFGKDKQISKIRSEYFKYSNMYLDIEIDSCAIFHPAYLLRQPIKKRDTWYDMLKILDYIKFYNVL